MARTALPPPVLSLLRAGVFLALAATAGAAQTEFPFAAGTDSTGRAQAVSDAAGRVLIESPEFPRGLWVHLADEAGQALAGIQVEYQGRADSLVTLRCVEPSGLRQETLLWIRPLEHPLQVILPLSELVDLPVGMTPVVWHVGRGVEMSLEPTRTRLVGWGAVEALFRERWRVSTGRVVIKLDDRAVAIDLDDFGFQNTGKLISHLRQMHHPVTASLADTPILEALVVEGSNSVILYTSLFEDEKLERAVRHILGVHDLWLERPPGFRITRQEVASWRGLYVPDGMRGIRSLVGLEHFISAERLDLHDNNIEDLSPLAGLTNLQEIRLDHNQISDVSPLATLTELWRLYLNDNEIVDIGPLASLTKLRRLFLGENQIVDIGPLGSLKNLRGLYLSGNQIHVLASLDSLRNLGELRLGANEITNVSPLASLTSLYALSLDNNDLKDFSSLASLTGLQMLSLNGNRIANVSPLMPLTGMWRLDLSDNEIEDISPLVDLTGLFKLHLQNNGIEDLSSLIANHGLGSHDTVTLQGNPLSDEAVNEQIPALRRRGVRVSY